MTAEKSGCPAVAIVGAGNFGSALALLLRKTRYRVREVVSREAPLSRRRARALASRIAARALVLGEDEIRADLVWLCVPDRDVTPCARALAKAPWKGHIALHSSGALGSDALQPLRARGVSVASVHPLMTFVPGVAPSLGGVAFAMEGDRKAVVEARRIVAALGGQSYSISPKDKSLYHAWATFTSPLVTILLAAGECVAQTAGISPKQARRRAAAILHQTVENYVRHGAARGFSGPIVRGDAATVRQHLEVLEDLPAAREVYRALARAALKTLPVRNPSALKKFLGRA